jgi:hypothetical protein
VLYFYEKQEALLQCEVRNTDVPDTYAIVITEADGRVRTHYINGANAAHRLWLAIEQQLRATGWSGPVGELGVRSLVSRFDERPVPKQPNLQILA